MNHFFHEFGHLIADSWVWLFIGILAGAAVQKWLRREWVERYVGGSRSSVLTASLAGALLPGCSMSVIPLAMGIRGKGGALGSMAAFILIAPLISPHTIFYAWALLGWEVTVFKTIAPFAIALPMGWLLNTLEARSVRGFSLVAAASRSSPPASARDQPCCYSKSAEAEEPSCHEEDTAPGYSAQVWKLIRSIFPYYLGALFIAAAVAAIWGEDALGGLLGDGSNWTAYALSALVAIPIYVCDGGSIPIAAALTNMGAAAGPVMTFLLAAETTCIPTIMMAPKIIGLRPTVLYVAAGFILSIGGGMLFQLVSGL